MRRSLLHEILTAALSRNSLTLTGRKREGADCWSRAVSAWSSSGKQRPPCSHDKHVALLGMQRHAVNTYEGGGGRAPRLLNLGTRLMREFSFMPRKKELLVLTEQEARWAPEQAWTLWRKLKSLENAKNRTRIPQPFRPRPRHYTH